MRNKFTGYKEHNGIIIPCLTIIALILYSLYVIFNIPGNHPGLYLLKFLTILAIIDIIVYCFSDEYQAENTPGKISLVISKFIQDLIIPLLFMFASTFLSMNLF